MNNVEYKWFAFTDWCCAVVVMAAHLVGVPAMFVWLIFFS